MHGAVTLGATIDQLCYASEKSSVQACVRPILIASGSSADPVVCVVSSPIHAIILLTRLMIVSMEASSSCTTDECLTTIAAM